LDSSESVAKEFPLAQEAAAQFVQTVIRPGVDESVFADFNERLTIRHRQWNGVPQLRNALSTIKAGGKTKAWDALVTAARRFFPQEDSAVRRVLILISDGNDAFSLHSSSEAVDALQRANVTVYAISTNTGRYESNGDGHMRKLASETGGNLFFPENAKGLTRVLQQIADDLSNGYMLFYTPPNTLRGEHRVEVACKRRGVTLRYRPVHHFTDTEAERGNTLVAVR
jgi:Ca-activated chloride channel family protein